MNGSLTDSILLKAYRGEKTSRPPIWLMRQAGRYLPEYREIRAKHPMLEVIRTPELAAKVTLQPIDRFGFDGAIIFADILTPLIGMGISLDFIEGEGPKIFNPLRTEEDVKKLKTPPPEENVAYTLKAIEITAKELTGKKVPLLGFSGAPFTLSTYLFGRDDETGSSTLTKIMRQDKKTWDALQKKLVTLVGEYLVAQVKSGASAVQLFDSWVGSLSPLEFETSVLPYLQEITKYVKGKTNAPVIYFATGTSGLLELFPKIGADIYGIDWRINLGTASKLLGGSHPLQGNLDPTILCEEWSYADSHVERVLDEGKKLKSFVFNLGHGILPHTPIGNVEKLVAKIKG